MTLSTLERRLRGAIPAGVDFASVRYLRQEDEIVSVRQDVPQPLVRAVDAGVMITVVADGALGYAATSDLSEGGLAVAAAEMAFAGNLGMELNLEAVPVAAGSSCHGGAPCLLFAESAGRFLVEVAPEQHHAFLSIVKDCPVGEIGRVIDTGRLIIKGYGGQRVIDVPLAEAKAAWQGTFA